MLRCLRWGKGGTENKIQKKNVKKCHDNHWQAKVKPVIMYYVCTPPTRRIKISYRWQREATARTTAAQAGEIAVEMVRKKERGLWHAALYIDPRSGSGATTK